MTVEDAHIWYNKGIIAYHRLDFEAALKAFDESLKFDPNAPMVWYHKGVTLGELEQYEKAIEAFSRTIELDAKNTLAWTNKCNVLMKMGRLDETLRVCVESMEALGVDAPILYRKATIYSRKNDKPHTLSDLEQAIKLDAKYKMMARKDENFKWLWDDADFKKIAG